MQRDGAWRGIKVVGRALRVAQYHPVRQFREPAVDRIVEADPAFFDEGQRGSGDDRLGHRGDADDRIAPDRCLRLLVAPAERADVGFLAVAMDERDQTGDLAAIDLTLQDRAQAFQACCRHPATLILLRCRHRVPPVSPGSCCGAA